MRTHLSHLAYFFCTICLFNLTAHATPSTPSHSLPPLESMNQLGELRSTLPTLHRFYANHNIPVIVASTHELPMVDISLTFKVGSAYDSHIRQDAHGTASMLATMLTQGTTRLNEDEFNVASETLGIELEASATKSSFSIHLRSLSGDKLGDAINLMNEIIKSPRLDTNTLARNKHQLITSLQQNLQRPNYVASLAFSEAIFDTHPYAKPTTGTIDSIQGLTSEDLLAYKNRFLVADNATITITGDVTKTQATHIANQLADSLNKAVPAPSLPVPTPATAQHIHITHNSPQTTIIMGNLNDAISIFNDSTMQETSDFALGNDVLAGGEFSARLMNEIRVKKGYTYGIYGSSQNLPTTSIYTISFSANGEVAKNAIIDTLNVINDTLTTGITHHELDVAKNSAIHGYPARFASNADIHGLIGRMNFYNMPDSYLTHRIHRVHRTNINNVNHLLRKNIRPNEFIIITVGDTPIDLNDIGIKSHIQQS